MKKKYIVFLLAMFAFFTLSGVTLAKSASEDKPDDKKTKGKVMLEKSGLPAGIYPKASKPLVTIVPSSSSRKMPRFDFLPKRVREESKA